VVFAFLRLIAGETDFLVPFFLLFLATDWVSFESMVPSLTYEGAFAFAQSAVGALL
jgi:hypothetical protein